jgi:hypothetical protein
MDELGKTFTSNSSKRHVEDNVYFESQVVDALMVETNALVPIKTASKNYPQK